MFGRILDHAEEARLSQLGRASALRAGICIAVALSAGALAMFAPLMSLLLLALLAARALMQGGEFRFDAYALIGPLLAAAIVGVAVGPAGAMGVLFVWRLQADTRWSIREASRLAMISGHPSETTPRALAHLWLTPLYGLALVAYTSPHMLAGLPLDLPHVQAWMPIAAACVAALGFADWALRAAADWRLGELAVAPVAHVLAHHALFLLAYGITGDVSYGVVALFAWRLMQAAPMGVAQPSLTAVP
ncbi:MAG: hypothetical protein QM759_00075 [Terricaulis sp.]